jgi:hypothetical protein
LLPDWAKLVEPKDSITLPVGDAETPIIPSPFKSCWKAVSADLRAALLPAPGGTIIDAKLPLLSVLTTMYSPLDVFFHATL